MEFPVMYPARYTPPAPAIDDLQSEVIAVLEASTFWRKMKTGARVGLTAGSRGISDIVPILSTVVQFLKNKGYLPCIIPAMGSHGGGTAEGQMELLAGLGITETVLGAPFLACSEVVRLGELEGGPPVYINKVALECDGLIIINRVKPHTSFHGPIESGLIKMMAVGLGNPKGAETLHGYGIRGLERYIPGVASYMMDRLPVWYGLAIVENAREQTAQIAGIEPEQFFDRERELLETARQLMPHLPFQSLDLLIVRSIGKCFSGTGMDTNIIGRLRIQGEPEPENPRIRRIAALDLDSRSKGNATGIGLADFTTDSLLAKVDWPATYLNVLSTTFVMRAMVPVHFPSEQETVAAALRSLGGSSRPEARVLVIDNTLDLSTVEFSEALLDEAEDQPYLQIVGDPYPMSFAKGRLAKAIV